MADDGTPSVAQTWLTPEIISGRKQRARGYADYSGIEEMHEKGVIAIKPQHLKVLLRAILPADAYDLAIGVAYDARQAVAHEIVAFGPGVDEWFAALKVPPEGRPQAGQHCFVNSAAADRLSKMDKTVRLWTTHIEDVVAAWDPPKVG